MNQSIYRYIKEHFSQAPGDVDKLIVSSFFRINKLTVKNNRLIKSYLIDEDNSDDSLKVDAFSALIKEHFSVITIETLIELFEFVISPSDRIVTGAVYTPENIREFILKDIFSQIENISKPWRACDFACGCGGFLYSVANFLKKKTGFTLSEIFRQHIFGLDIKSYSVNRTKILLSTYAILEGEDVRDLSFNIYEGDALDFVWSNVIGNFGGFNCIVGNPPYVCSRKIPQKTKKKLKKFSTCQSGHPDLYIPFFQIGLELLVPNGFLGFITMNSFFKSLNGRDLRAYFHIIKNKLKIIDFGTLQVFRKKSTYTCICIFQNLNSDCIQYRKLDKLAELSDVNSTFVSIPYAKLKAHSGWNLVHTEIINRIEQVGKPLSIRFKSRNGIATLKNEIYIFKPYKTDKNFYYYFYDDDNIFPIEKAICKEVVNPNKLVSQTNMDQLLEKFIFPYEYIDGKAIIYAETKLKEKFPCAHKYLLFQKETLAKRDKKKKKYPKWFAFGRTQSLEKLMYKLFFPHIAPGPPNFLISENEDLYFYNGIAVIGESRRELEFLTKLMSSRLFWFYIRHTSKPYSASYFSLSKNYIKDFGIYNFSEADINYIIEEENSATLDRFFETKYQVTLPN